MGMARFTSLVDGIDRLNTAIGRAASWCALAVVLIGFAVVLLRYVLGLGSIWLQESILYAHSALFLLAAFSCTFAGFVPGLQSLYGP